MNSNVKWILGVGAATAVATIFRKVFTLVDSSKTLSFLPRLDIKKIRLVNGIFGKLIIPVEVEVNNASANEINLILRSLKLFQKNTSQAAPVELAYTTANPTVYPIQAGKLTVLKGIEFQVPITSLLSLLPGIKIANVIQNPAAAIPKGLYLETVFTANGINSKISTEITA